MGELEELREENKALKRKLYLNSDIVCMTKQALIDSIVDKCQVDYAVISFEIDVSDVNEKMGNEKGLEFIKRVVAIINKKDFKVYHWSENKFVCFIYETEYPKTNYELFKKVINDIKIPIYCGVAYTRDFSSEPITPTLFKKVCKKSFDKMEYNKKDNTRQYFSLNDLRLEKQDLELQQKQNEELRLKVLELKDVEQHLLDTEREIQELKRKTDEKLSDIIENINSTDEKDNVVLGTTIETENEDMVETEFSKNVKTLWYSTIRVEMMAGKYCECEIKVYPLRFKKPLQTLETLAYITINRVKHIIKIGKNIEFYIENAHCGLISRFTKDGKLETNFIVYDKEYKPEIEIQSNTTTYTPKHFGKFIKTNDSCYELYPLAKNMQGFYSYALIKVLSEDETDKDKIEDFYENLTDENAFYNEEGTIDIDGKLYSVNMDEISLYLADI